MEPRGAPGLDQARGAVFFPRYGTSASAPTTTHVDPGTDHRASAPHRGERERHQRPHRSEEDCGVELFRRSLHRASRPHGAQLAREPLRLRIPRAREGEYPPPLEAGHLRNQVCRRAEPIEPESFRVARGAQRAIADEPGAKQWRRLQIRVGGREREAEPRLGARVLSIAPVQLVAGEDRLDAQVLSARSTEATRAARVAKPGDADAVAFAEAGAVLRRLRTQPFHRANDLVAGHDRQPGLGQLAVDQVQVGPADAAGANAHDQIAWAGLGDVPLDRLERSARPLQHHCAHANLSRASSGARGGRRWRRAARP